MLAVCLSRAHTRIIADTIRIITGGRLVLTSPVCSPRQVGSLQLHDENMVTRLPRLTPRRTGSPVTGAERVGGGAAGPQGRSRSSTRGFSLCRGFCLPAWTLFFSGLSLPVASSSNSWRGRGLKKKSLRSVSRARSCVASYNQRCAGVGLYQCCQSTQTFH